MSSDFTVPPPSRFLDANSYASEIHDLFYQRWIILNNERQGLIDKIDEWRDGCLEHINTYANEQKALINNHYNHQRPIFDEKYRENLEIANAYHVARQVELFNELREACQLLKFQVATLKFSRHKIEYPKMIVLKEQLETKNLEEKDNARRRRRLNKINSDTTESTIGASATSPSDSTTSDSQQTDDHQSSKMKPKGKIDPSTVNTDDSKNQVINDDQSNNKCPICFMIFPLNMTRDNRQLHVNEHYTDD